MADKTKKVEDVNQNEENSQQEPKKEGKGKKLIRAIGRELMFTLIGAGAVGAVWAYTGKSGKDSKREKDSDEDTSEEESEEKND